MASDASNVTTGNAHEDMHTRFRNEFGIHFSESELQFALSFLDEVFEEGVKAERERVMEILEKTKDRVDCKKPACDTCKQSLARNAGLDRAIYLLSDNK